MKPLFAVLLFVNISVAQENKFWDTERKTETIVFTGAIILDGWATQTGVRSGNFMERNPFARPFITRGIAGQCGASALGLAIGVGPSYLFYRAGHKKASRIWLSVFAAGETINAAQMAYTNSR